MNSDNVDEAKYLLKKLIVAAGDEVILAHPWFFEEDRWQELVCAFLIRQLSLPENEVRYLIGEAGELELLEIETLGASDSDPKTKQSIKQATQRIHVLMQEFGVSADDADKATDTIVQLAGHFVVNYQGKVQHFVRRYGEKMISDFKSEVKIGGLDDDNTSAALTYWLQNSMNMPLSMRDGAMVSYCKRHGLKLEQLLDAADELGINHSLLDDLILVGELYETEEITRS